MDIQKNMFVQDTAHSSKHANYALEAVTEPAILYFCYGGEILETFCVLLECDRAFRLPSWDGISLGTNYS